MGIDEYAISLLQVNLNDMFQTVSCFVTVSCVQKNSLLVITLKTFWKYKNLLIFPRNMVNMHVIVEKSVLGKGKLKTVFKSEIRGVRSLSRNIKHSSLLSIFKTGRAVNLMIISQNIKLLFIFLYFTMHAYNA